MEHILEQLDRHVLTRRASRQLPTRGEGIGCLLILAGDPAQIGPPSATSAGQLGGRDLLGRRQAATQRPPNASSSECFQRVGHGLSRVHAGSEMLGMARAAGR